MAPVCHLLVTASRLAEVCQKRDHVVKNVTLPKYKGTRGSRQPDKYKGEGGEKIEITLCGGFISGYKNIPVSARRYVSSLS